MHGIHPKVSGAWKFPALIRPADRLNHELEGSLGSQVATRVVNQLATLVVWWLPSESHVWEGHRLHPC